MSSHDDREKYVIQVAGKRVDMRRAFPVLLRDTVNVQKMGANPDAFAAKDPMAGVYFLFYYVNKANPDLTLDNILDMTAKDFELACEMFGELRKEQEVNLDRPT